MTAKRVRKLALKLVKRVLENPEARAKIVSTVRKVWKSPTVRAKTTSLLKRLGGGPKTEPDKKTNQAVLPVSSKSQLDYHANVSTKTVVANRSTTRVVTWNINPWQIKSAGGPERAWAYAIDQLDCDVLLFQEGKPPGSIQTQTDHFLSIQTRAGQVGVYCPRFRVEPLTQPNPLAKSHWLATKIEMPGDQPLIAISAYGLMDKVGVIANLHTMLSDLAPVLLEAETLRPKAGARIILGGDLNATPQWDQHYYKGKQRPHGLFFDRLADCGLVSVFNLAKFDGYTQTLRSKNSDQPWQNDWLFVSRALAGDFISCQVVDNETVRGASDHNPVLIEIKTG